MFNAPSCFHALSSAAAFILLSSGQAVAHTKDREPLAASNKAERQRISWTEETRRVLISALDRRVDHGLDRVTFIEAAPDGEQPEERDARFTRAALSYAGALARGQIDPAALHEVYTLRRPDLELEDGLRLALDNRRLATWLAGLPPQDDDYGRLSKAYISSREQASSDRSTAKIAARGLIHVGDSDERVRDVAQRLVDNDYLPADSGPGGSRPQTYTQDMADAITALQADFGIAADGVVGPDTLSVLNMGPADRGRALAVALERRRWLPRSPPETRIDVNIAAARLRYWRDGKLIDERPVVVGGPGHETPMLGSPIYRLVANPTWTVPKSIQNTEMADVGASYLDAHNMVIKAGWIVQQPGPNNALGLVKFDMQNQQAIYLHDTASPELFDRSQRHLSHGCVRVSDALGFADMLAEHEGVTEQWAQARDSGEQTFVSLPHHVPVRLIYANVFVESKGRIVFRTDPYGWNGPVAKGLGFHDGPAAKSKAQPVDNGP